MEYSFSRYLAAKKSVDDRALNAQVWQALRDEIARTPHGAPWRVIELGAGIGTMVERILEADLFASLHYITLDYQAENIHIAGERLKQWAIQHGFEAEEKPGSLILSSRARRIRIDWLIADALAYAARPENHGAYDVLVAHALLDLIDLPSGLPVFFKLLSPGGLFYLTLNFDGLTELEPQLDPLLDEKIWALYHRSMDERRVDGKPSGDSRAGRRLFTQIEKAGGSLLLAGASDWVVFPRRKAYPQDEAYFLHFIINTIHQALRYHPELPGAAFEAWIEKRHRQIEAGELVYIAHQLDFLGKKDIIST